MSRPANCPKCEIACANAKAAGHRDWREGCCFDCAAGDLDEIFARIGYVPDEAVVARELAKMAASRPTQAPATAAQPSLFDWAAA